MSGIIWQTMKTLYLLRHAKSSWDDARLTDLERPLNGRGRRTAPFMGELMRERGYLPELIVCSPAVRAKETATYVAESAELIGKIHFDDRIYEASPNVLLEIVCKVKDKYASAMLVGHNPGMEGLVRYLTGKLEPMPTAALAVIKLDSDKWSDVIGGCGELKTVIRPKDEMK